MKATKTDLIKAATDLVETLELVETPLNSDLDKMTTDALEKAIKVVADTEIAGESNWETLAKENADIKGPDKVKQETKDVLGALDCDPGVGIKGIKKKAPAKKKEKSKKPLPIPPLNEMDTDDLIKLCEEKGQRVPPIYRKTDRVEKFRIFVSEKLNLPPDTPSEKKGTEKKGTEKKGTEKKGTEKKGTEKKGTEKDEFGFREGTAASRFCVLLKNSIKKGLTMAEAAEKLNLPKGTTFYSSWKKLQTERLVERRKGRMYFIG